MYAFKHKCLLEFNNHKLQDVIVWVNLWNTVCDTVVQKYIPNVFVALRLYWTLCCFAVQEFLGALPQSNPGHWAQVRGLGGLGPEEDWGRGGEQGPGTAARGRGRRDRGASTQPPQCAPVSSLLSAGQSRRGAPPVTPGAQLLPGETSRPGRSQWEVCWAAARVRSVVSIRAVWILSFLSYSL